MVTVEQTLVALIIARLTDAHDPRIGALFAAVLAGGIGQAFYAPTFSALIPTLVERKDLPGAISLNSANMNLSRVIGPAIGGVLYAKVGASWAFVVNAASYLALIWALATVRLPAHHRAEEQGWRRILDGFDVARRDRVVGRCLTTMVLFSFFCLPIAVLMPVLAHNELGIGASTIAYGLLYATFGTGAVIGALSIGTFLAGQQLERVVRFGIGGYAVTLAVFGLLRSPGPAYPVVLPPRSVLLRDGDVARHRAPEATRRLRARPGDGPLGDGVRRHGSPRCHRRRSAQRTVQHLGRGPGRRRRRRRTGLLRQSPRALTRSGTRCAVVCHAGEFSAGSVPAPDRLAGHGLCRRPVGIDRRASGPSSGEGRPPTPPWPRPRSWP